MEIILRETIDNLGRAGQVVKVADGYARNYLLPKKLAYVATPGNLKVIEAERQSLQDELRHALAEVARADPGPAETPGNDPGQAAHLATLQIRMQETAAALRALATEAWRKEKA